MSAVWYCTHYFILFAIGINNTSGTGGKICRWRCWYRWQICHLWHWYRWCTFTCEYLREFLINFEMTLMLFLWAWGKMIHEKNPRKKISWHCPLNLTQSFRSEAEAMEERKREVFFMGKLNGSWPICTRGGFVNISSSPELWISWRDHWVSSAGSFDRGSSHRPRALLGLHLIWFGYIARLGGRGYFTNSDDFFMPSQSL